MNNFIVRTITGILFVAVLVGSFVYSQWTMMLLFALITGLTVWEFCTLANQREQVTVNRFICTVAGVYLFLSLAGYNSGMTPSTVFIPYLVSIIYLLVAELYLKQPDPINKGQVVYNFLLPLSVFIFLWMNDTGAYCVGSLLGRNKLFPRISPGKSWEGSIGGAVVVLLVAWLIGAIDNGQLSIVNCQLSTPTGADAALLTISEWLGLGLVVVLFGTWGDLVESLFKRTLGIKDSGHILPGHGGMLDRFDSSLLAIPAAVVYLYTLTLF